MSSLDHLVNRVQMMTEAKVSPVGKQAPVFKDVPKQMKAAGLAASSRDAMIFITQVLSRLDIISPEVYEMTIKGQHKERMEKLMTILRSKEEEINAKSDEIVEYINQNLDNYTAGAGSDRNRSEKYKETAKAMSQEVQNIKAGKEADDALRDIAVTVAKGLDSEVTDADVDALDFDEADIHLNIADQELKKATAEKIAAQLNANGYTAGVSGVGVNIEAPIGTFGSSADVDAMETAQDQLKGLVMSVEPSIGENDIVVKITTQEGTVSHEDAEGRHDDGDDVDERCDYVPCEDGEGSLAELYRKDMLAAIDQQVQSMVGDGVDPTTGSKFSEAEISDLYRQAAERNLSKFKRLNKHSNGKQQDRVDVAQSILDEFNKTQAANVASEDNERKVHSFHTETDSCEACSDPDCQGCDGDEDEEVVAESHSTADYLEEVYATVKPIENTVNENGQVTPSITQEYLVESAEAAIEEAYTNVYLTEQKASDSLLVSKEEKSQSFKERYQPKTSYQLEELRRYGL